MRLLFDLDGVIRNLHIDDGYPDKWDSDIVKRVNADLTILIRAQPTEYYSTIKELDNLTIITHQPCRWRQFTVAWLNNYLPDAEVIFTRTANGKLKYIQDSLLIEDNPNLPDIAYSNIILVDRPYNQRRNCRRIYSPDWLRLCLKEGFDILDPHDNNLRG